MKQHTPRCARPYRRTHAAPCVAGSSCPDPAVASVACVAGTYSAGPGAALCSACPVATYAALSGATYCLPCPAGNSCSNAAVLPTPCVPGTAALYGRGICTPCAAQMYSNLTGGITCMLAPLGYDVTNAATPVPCPAGWACANASAPVACRPGLFSTGGAVTCTPCLSGWSCPLPDGSANAQCGAGTFALGNATSCVTCPAGSACATAVIAPILCGTGQWSSPGAVVCLSAADGHLTAAGATAPAPGSAGCPQGGVCPSLSLSNLTMRTNESTSNAAVTYIPCPAGTRAISNMTAFSIAEGCEMCPAGFFCGVGGTEASTVPCPSGAWCPAGSQLSPIACVWGTFNNKMGSFSSSDCLPCPGTFYCPTGSSNGFANICPPVSSDRCARYTLRGALLVRCAHLHQPSAFMFAGIHVPKCIRGSAHTMPRGILLWSRHRALRRHSVPQLRSGRVVSLCVRATPMVSCW